MRFSFMNAPAQVQAHNLTDKELLVLVEHQFPNPGPIIGALIQRFEQRIRGHVVELEQGDGLHEADDKCPACGTALEVVASI